MNYKLTKEKQELTRLNVQNDATFLERYKYYKYFGTIEISESRVTKDSQDRNKRRNSKESIKAL